MNAVIARTLRESWRGVLGWTIGLGALMCLYLSLYPSIGIDGQMAQMLKTLPEQVTRTLGFDQLTSGAGYAQATFYGLLGFVLPTVANIGWGSAAVAGAEESGRLELDLSHGISRAGYVLAQVVAVVARAVWLGVATGCLLLVLNQTASLDIDPVNVIAVSASAVGLMLLHGMVALTVGTALGRRSPAIVAGALVAAGGFALNAVANQQADLDWLRVFSPYSWAFHDAPLSNGPTGGLLPIWLGVLLLAAVSTFILTRRDLRA